MEDRIRQALQDLYPAQLANNAPLTCLGGHASLRIYWRIDLPAGTITSRQEDTTLMAMVMPLDLDLNSSEEGGDQPTATQWPFKDVQSHLDAANLPVPQIDLMRLDIGVVLLEDLGSTHFEDLYLETLNLPQAQQYNAQIALYKRAIDLLITAQAAVTQTPNLPKTIAHARSFDATLLKWELDHFMEWGLQAQYGKTHTAKFESKIDAHFDQIVDELLQIPQVLVFRDYQSRNIMVKRGVLHLIDFQDALMGSCVYDLVALLRDSYIVLPNDMVDALISYYVEAGRAAGLSWCEDLAQVRRWFYLQAVQRKLKDAGRFIFIDRVKNNPDFLGYYEPSLHYIQHALSQLPEHEALSVMLGKLEAQWPENASQTYTGLSHDDVRAFLAS